MIFLCTILAVGCVIDHSVFLSLFQPAQFNVFHSDLGKNKNLPSCIMNGLLLTSCSSHWNITKSYYIKLYFLGSRVEFIGQVKATRVNKTKIKPFTRRVIVRNGFQFPRAYFLQFLTRFTSFLIAICKKDFSFKYQPRRITWFKNSAIFLRIPEDEVEPCSCS